MMPLENKRTVEADSLAVVTTHFNPQRYCLPLRNYWEWRHSLGEMQRHLFTMELSFDGHFSIHDSIKINGGPENILWQKEALINECVKRLPDRYRFVAWVDHDLISDNPEWAVATQEQLQSGVEVTQLFESVDDFNADGSFRRNLPGAAWKAIHGSDKYGRPGAAWAARRDFLNAIGGLVDNNIVGGGDAIACDAWCGKSGSYYFSVNPPRLAEDNRRWHENVNRVQVAPVSYVTGKMKHLFHGTVENRQYKDRVSILTDTDFNPHSDIRKNADGIWEWCSDKPDLHCRVADYFASRREDG